MADEIDEFELWVRNNFINPLHFAAVIGYTFKAIPEAGTDIFDMFRRFFKHDFYEMGRDYADMFILVFTGEIETELSESDYQELDIDDI